MLALHTGMRRGEILNLAWEGVNLREGYIELVDQKNGERSTIPLNRKAIETIQSIPRHLDSKYLFPGKTPDKPFYDMKRHFEKAVSAAKLDGVTFHVLRHTCASHLVMSGVDLATVKEIMRHKTIEMTLRYAHLSPEHKKSAIAALESALTPKKEKKDKKAQIA
jgi:integrase